MGITYERIEDRYRATCDSPECRESIGYAESAQEIRKALSVAGWTQFMAPVKAPTNKGQVFCCKHGAHG